MPYCLRNTTDMPDIFTTTLYGGPCDGEQVELHHEQLDLKARI